MVTRAYWFCFWIWIVGDNYSLFFFLFFLIPYDGIEYIRVRIHCLCLLGWNVVFMHNQIRSGPYSHFETQCTWNREPLILLTICWRKRRPPTAPLTILKLKGALPAGNWELGSTAQVWISPSHAPHEFGGEFFDFPSWGLEWNIISK